MTRSPRGMTLVEVLVAMVLLALLISAVYMLLMPALKYFPPANDRSKVEQAGAVVAMALTTDLQQAPMASMSIQPQTVSDPLLGTTEVDTVTFLSPVGPDGNVLYSNVGQPLWQKFVQYSVDSQWRLVRWQGFFNEKITTPVLSVGYLVLKLPNYEVLQRAGTFGPVQTTTHTFDSTEVHVVAQGVHRFACSTPQVTVGSHTQPTNPLHVTALLISPNGFQYPVDTEVSSATSQ